MKKLNRFHATKKVSYSKGVLYKVERAPEGRQRKKGAKGIFRRMIEAIDGFFSDNHSRRKTNVDLVTAGDKRFYITGAVVALCVICVTAIVTMLVAAKNTVSINDEGRISYAAVEDGQTVYELLSDNNIVINEGDAVEVSEEQTLTDGMQIVIHRAMPVTVYADGKQTTVNMLAGTVDDVIKAADVQVSADDEVYPAGSTYITNGMTVNVIRVETEIVTRTSEIEYKELRLESDKYEKGKEILYQKGVKGELQKEIKLTYKDGELFSETVIESKVVKEAVDEIVYVGTYVAPVATPRPNTGNTGGNTGGNSGGNTSGGKDYGQDLPQSDGLLTKLPSISQIHSGTLKEHKSVPGPAASLISEVITAEITAYAGDDKTATGVRPRIGTVAVDPRKIPYGTILFIPGYGYGRAEDTGGYRDRVSGYWLDLYMETESQCNSWGRKKNYKVYILKG